MQLLALGELTTHLSEDFKAAYPEMDWRNIEQLRNVCAHRCGTIDYKLICDIVHVDISNIWAFCDEQLALYEMLTLLTQPAVEEEYNEEL